jgi:hypothetical protein
MLLLILFTTMRGYLELEIKILLLGGSNAFRSILYH